MPFLGKTPSQIVDPEVDIDGGAIDGVSIGSVTASAGAFTNLTATGTLTLPDDGISGDDVNGGTISNFASTGIDDNATSTQISLTNAVTSVDNILKPASIKFNGATGITWEETISDVLYTRYGLSYGGNRLSFTYDGSTIARFLSSGEFEVYNDLTVDTDTLVVDSTNNWVGIGTTPDTDVKLTVADSGTAFMRLRSTDASGDAIFQLGNATDTNQARVVFLGADESLNFYTSDAKRVTIADTGEVGIGTSSPTEAKLVIEPATQGDTPIHVDTLTTGVGTINPIIQAQGLIDTTLVRMNFVRGSVSTSGGITFDTTSGGTTAERMRIDESGNVGIGVTPTNKLDIGGGITVQQAADIKWQNTARNTTYGGIRSTASALSLTWNGSDAVVVNSTGDVDIGGNLTAGNGSVDISMSATADGHIKIDGNGYDGAIALDATGMNIYHNSSSRGMFFGINETARMAISSGGDVGIGNTNPTGARAGSGYRHLDIKSDQLDVGGSLRLTNSDESSQFRIFNSDTVGTRLGTYSFNTVDIYTDSNFVARFDTSGNFLVNATNTPSVLISATSGNGQGAEGVNAYYVVKRDSSSAAYYANKTGQTTSQATNYIQFRNQGTRTGHVDYDGADVGISQYSDERLKENIQDASGGLAIVNDAQVRSFDWKDGFKQSKRFGFVAQELIQVFPDAVKEGGEDPLEDPWTVNEAKFIPVLVKAIQEQQAIIEDLQTRLSALEAN